MTATHQATWTPGASPHAVLWQPPRGWVGDVIPFHHDGWFWLYYLHDWRGVDGRPAATSWHLVRTRDLVTYEDLGEVLPHGGPADQDRNCYTGSIVEADGRFHLFYTGVNQAIVDPADGLPLQAVMHAISDDLIHWHKQPGDTFHAPPGRLESHDWRDPFVFRDPTADRWLMLLASRERTGLSRRRGVIAACSSADLTTWRSEEPFWAPGLFVTMECPEVFPLADRWYLLFSEFSERFTAQYRMGPSALGPWVGASDPTLDGRAWYAPRTASDGVHRYAFGWIATRAGETDAGAWEWAGTLAAHELMPAADGTLCVRLPGPVRASFTDALPVHPSAIAGAWSETSPTGVVGASPSGFAIARMGALPGVALLGAEITFSEGTRACGIALRLGDDDPDAGVYVRLEPGAGRLVLDRWPRRAPGHQQWMIDGDVPHAVELERMATLEPGRRHRLDILVDGSALIAYLDGTVAMSARIHDRPQGDWGVFVSEGSTAFSDLSVRVRGATQE